MSYIDFPLFGGRFWGSPVDTLSSLPVSGSIGEVRITLDTQDAYMWDGFSWIPVFGSAGGGGDVNGPASSVDGQAVVFNGITGKAVRASTATGVAKLASGVLSASAVDLTTEVTGVLPAVNGGFNNARAINTTAPLAGGGDLSADRTLSMPAATGAQDGYLTSTDFTAFSAKQPAGNYITSIGGDLVATGPGAVTGTIQSGAVTNAKIAAAAGISLDKLAALTASTGVVSDASGFLVSSIASSTEVGYLSGVTSALQTQLDAKLNLSGGVLTGALTLNADPAAALQAATKQYVDSVASGLSPRAAVFVATTANITRSGEQTLDGVLTSASRVLVKNQTLPAENGIYISAAGAWSRATDMDTWAEVPSAFAFVEQGTVQADTGWVCTSDSGGTLGVTAVTFVQFSGAGSYAASGQGITLTGNTFSFQIDGTTLTQSNLGAKVASGGITDTEVAAAAAIARTKLASGAINRLITNNATGVMTDLAAITAQKALVSDVNGLPIASATSDVELGYVSGVTSAIQTQLDSKEATVALPTARFVFSDTTTGALTTYGEYQYDTTTLGSQVGITLQPNNAGGINLHNYSLTLVPLQNSPGDSFSFLDTQVTIDPTSSGFSIGTAGTCVNLQNNYIEHHGTSDVGGIDISTSYANLGNGTDPINIKGYNGYFIFGDINDNVNMTAGFQGFVFQPHVHSLATTTAGGTFSNIFTDASNIECVTDGWNSFNASPQLAGIRSGNNFTGLNVGPTIGTMQGNSGITGVSINGQVTGLLGTSGYTGLQVNPGFADLNANSHGLGVFGQATTGNSEWLGLDIQTDQVLTTGSKRGARIITATDLTKDHIALEASGRCSLHADVTMVTGLGLVSGHDMGGAVIIPNGTAITGTDIIADNLGFSVNTGDAGSSFTSTSIIGLSTLGFVGALVGDGDVAANINFCLAGFQDGRTSGTVDRINNFMAGAFPAGAGIVTEHVLFNGVMPAGNLALNSWGVRIDADMDNYFAKNVVVGPTAFNTFKPTNDSVGIEIAGTTKALLPSRLTTVERDALTAVDGMVIYNSTTNQHQGYQNGVWEAFAATTTGVFTLPSFTTAARNALTPAAGMMIYNTTVNTTQVYVAGTVNDWVDSLGWGATYG